VLHACGFDLDLQLILYEPPDERDDARLREELAMTPQERLQAMLEARRKS
jgi:hypothetical protein